MGMITPDARVYVAGHRGMVGSAVWRALEGAGYADLVGWSSSEVDLTDRDAAMDAVRSAKPDVVVGISIQEMHADAAGQARLDASWSLKSGQAGLVPHRFSCRQPASVSDYSLIVSALNGCLEKLDREIAAEIQRASR